MDFLALAKYLHYGHTCARVATGSEANHFARLFALSLVALRIKLFRVRKDFRVVHYQA